MEEEAEADVDDDDEDEDNNKEGAILSLDSLAAEGSLASSDCWGTTQHLCGGDRR